MNNTKINREEKDALFKLVFGDYPENALSLYNAINGTDYTNCNDLEITTLRGLGYFSDLYKAHLGGEEESLARMYDSKLIRIPAPKYYVFYNGMMQKPEKMDLRLSDAYEGDGDIEITAHMLNVNAGNNSELMDNCKPLSEYSVFIDRVREYLKQGMSKEEAIERAIDSCIEDSILEKILREERAKVENILIRGLTEEEQQLLRELQIKDARKEGRFNSVDKLVEKGCAKDVEEACDILEVDINEYRDFKENKVTIR